MTVAHCAAVLMKTKSSAPPSLALDLVEPGRDEHMVAARKTTEKLPEGVTSKMMYRDVVRIAWPSFIELTLTQLASMVDLMMVGKLGAAAIAGVGLTTQPKFLMMTMFQAMNVGATALVARHKGASQQNKANLILRQALLLTLVLSLIGGVLVFLFAEPLVQFMGAAEASTLADGTIYLKIQALGIVTVALTSTITASLRGAGNSRTAMMYNLTANVVNVIFNYLLIYGNFGFPRMEVAGASLATVIGQVATAFLAVWYLLHMKIIKPASGDYALRGTVCGRMLTLGITSFLSQISLVAAMAAINNMLRKYGALDAVFGQEQYAQIPMAVVGIVMKFFQIVISIVVGMAAGCIPIVGYNMGAEKKLRVRELFTKLLIAEALVGAVALVMAEGFPRQLIAIFGAANESSYYTEFAIKAFRTYLCMMVLACVNKACFIFLQAVGKALTSTLLSMFREVVFGVGFALLLPVFFGLDGVLYSMPVSDILTFIISAIIIVKTYRELNVEGVQKV